MDHNSVNETRQDFRKVRSAKGGLLFRVVGICVVLYWLAELVVAYCKGGPDAPDLTLLIAATVIMGGGAALVGVLTWKAWKLEKEAAKLTEEEIAELDALRAEEEE
ncbi:MAG: hypothetical protein IJA84_01740 [Clostridia bacterium]|nr:hypothetical protein [Clostridia bacterium]